MRVLPRVLPCVLVVTLLVAPRKAHASGDPAGYIVAILFTLIGWQLIQGK